MKCQKIIMTASLLLALAVIIGAFGAHVLGPRLGAHYLNVYETGVHYQFYGSLGVLLIGILAVSHPSRLLHYAAGLLVLGVVLFSGSLYVLAVTKIKMLGIITPFGGMSMIAGWLCLFFAVRRERFSGIKN